jgi:hypothetical protein
VTEVLREEARKRSEWVSVGLRAARDNGAATTAPPWGYQVIGRKHQKRFEPTADGRRYVPEIYRRAAAGESVTSIARWLNERQAGGKHWSATTVSGLLRNPAMKGTVVNRAGAVIHRCEPLVGAALWKRADAAVNAPDKRKRGPNKAASMLSKVGRCGNCGAPLYRLHAERGLTKAFYRCWGKPSCFMSPVVRVDATVSHLLNSPSFDTEVTEEVYHPGRNHDTMIEAVSDELRRLGLRGLDEEAEDQLRAALRAERRRLEALPTVPESWETVGAGVTYAQEWRDLPEAERSAWLRRRGFTVRVWPDRVRVRVRGQELAASPMLAACPAQAADRAAAAS